MEKELVPKQPRQTKERQGMSRRDLLGGMGVVGLGLGVLSKGYTERHSREKEREFDPDVSETESVPIPQPRPERIPRAELFTKEVLLHAARYQLAYNEIQFYDTEENPVGEPIAFEDFVVERTRIKEDGAPEVFEYLLTPGPMNDAGMVENGIAREWAQYMREQVVREHPEVDLADDYLHVSPDFIAAYNRPNNALLREAIDRGEVRRYDQLVRFFANQPAYEGSGRSRREYLQQEIRFADSVPPLVQEELRRLVLGLVALESKFEPGLTNPGSKATGIMQFLPSTWKAYNDDPEQIHDFRAQVAAAGTHLSRVYERTLHFIGEQHVQRLQDHFGTEERFARHFLVPAVLNGYKAGEKRVAKGIASVLDSVDLTTLPKNKDFFIILADQLKESNDGLLEEFGTLSRAYVPQVYAQTILLLQNSSQ